jgi:hypothetical protein
MEGRGMGGKYLSADIDVSRGIEITNRKVLSDGGGKSCGSFRVERFTEAVTFTLRW